MCVRCHFGRGTWHVATAILDGGSHETSAILEVGQVVGSGFPSDYGLCVVAAVGALHHSGSLCSWFCREGSGSEGHEPGSKRDHLSYRVFARSQLQKAAGCPCKSEDF